MAVVCSVFLVAVFCVLYYAFVNIYQKPDPKSIEVIAGFVEDHDFGEWYGSLGIPVVTLLLAPNFFFYAVGLAVGYYLLWQKIKEDFT